MLLCLLLPVRLSLDANDLGVVNQSVNQGHHAGSVGEYFAPVGKRFVGREQRAFLLVAAASLAPRPWRASGWQSDWGTALRSAR
jgi:hypothetical protein